MTKNKAKELSYYLFFGLMVLAKGIGLDSGDKLYYILSAAACLCVGCKLILTKYKIRQITAMILLCLIAFAAYRNSGRMGILLSVLAIIGLKDMDVKKLFRLGTVIYSLSFAFTIVMAKTGIIGNPLVVHEKGGMEVIRWGMGYSTGNVFHISYFILSVFLCYTWEKRYDVKKFAGLMAGNLLVFLFSLSYTGVAVTAFYLILNLYAVKRKRLSMAEKVICLLPLPLCLLFSFGVPFLLQYPVVQKMDHMMQARLTFSAYYLQNQPVTLFGTRMKDVPNFWVIMDNGYVYFFMTFGIAAFVLLCIGYGVVILRYIKRDNLPELAMIFSFLLYGIMEQFISNAFMNLSLLFLGEALFGCTGGVENGEASEAEAVWGRDVEYRKGKGFQRLVCGGIGIGILGIYFMIVPMHEYIEVPLKSLNYISAQSIQISVNNEDGTKEDLKEKMTKYKKTLEQTDILEAAIRSAGVSGKISAGELAAALEYSLPIYVQKSKSYETFRIRILELYYDITEDEYEELLRYLIGKVQEIEGTQYTVREGLYAERVGKSFGEDRIEHMSADKNYMVEKSGSIVKMEYYRDGMFYAVLGMASIVLACQFPVICQKMGICGKITGKK